MVDDLLRHRGPSDGNHWAGYNRPHERDCLPQEEDPYLMTRIGEGVGVMEWERRLRRIG